MSAQFPRTSKGGLVHCHCPAPERCSQLSISGEALQASQFSHRGIRHFSTFPAPPHRSVQFWPCLPFLAGSQLNSLQVQSTMTADSFFPHHSATMTIFSMIAFYKDCTWHSSTTNVRSEQLAPTHKLLDVEVPRHIKRWNRDLRQ